MFFRRKKTEPAPAPKPTKQPKLKDQPETVGRSRIQTAEGRRRQAAKPAKPKR